MLQMLVRGEVRRKVWVSKKRLETLEKKVADLEKQVQDQSLEKVAIELENWVKQFVGLTFHTPESPQQKF